MIASPRSWQASVAKNADISPIFSNVQDRGRRMNLTPTVFGASTTRLKRSALLSSPGSANGADPDGVARQRFAQVETRKRNVEPNRQAWD
jgi:hypothetical protein